jgi:hypothetical protein|tara:strand:- start:627 stop:1196 length:570 start_codon:yes stop_codon:yes gene_type:complete
MLRFIKTIPGIIVASIYAYGSYMAGRYHQSIFESGWHWIFVDIITIIILVVWSNSKEMYAMPEVITFFVVIVTILGIIQIAIPSLGFIIYFVNEILLSRQGAFFPFANFWISIGIFYHCMDELSLSNNIIIRHIPTAFLILAAILFDKIHNPHPILWVIVAIIVMGFIYGFYKDKKKWDEDKKQYFPDK